MDDLPAVPVEMDDADVARLFEQLNLLTAPVVDANGLLLGRITVDDIVDVIRDEGDRSLMSMAGLDEEEDLFAPVLTALASGRVQLLRTRGCSAPAARPRARPGRVRRRA